MRQEIDFDALSEIETETVTVYGQKLTVSMLVPEDIEKCRKLIRRGKLNEELAMEYMTFQSLQKAHPDVTWMKFQRMNFKVVNRLMAVMAVLNGFDESFRAFGRGTAGNDDKPDDEDDEMDL